SRLRRRARPLDGDPRAARRGPPALAGPGFAHSRCDSGGRLDPHGVVSSSTTGGGGGRRGAGAPQAEARRQLAVSRIPSPAVTPEEFLKKLAGWSRGTMIESHGTRFVSVGPGRAAAELDFKPALAQLTGRFHAGAIIALAEPSRTRPPRAHRCGRRIHRASFGPSCSP